MVAANTPAPPAWAPDARGPVLFVSYSRTDAEWRRKFEEMLKPLVRQRHLEVWGDARNVVGEEWRPQLAEAIARAHAAVLLVSRDFLASDFIMQQELPALLERRIRLIPVLLRECLWDRVPAIERLQWAHDPRRDGAVATSQNPEGQIVQVCNELLSVLPEVIVPEEPSLAALVRARAEPVVASSARGKLHGVPPLPSFFVERPELARLRDRVLATGSGTVGVAGRPLGLQGEGGIGKSVLAAALANDETVQRHFPDGVFWVTVGERDEIVTSQAALLGLLGSEERQLRSMSEARDVLAETLAGKRSLIVVDDVWSVTAAKAFRVTGPQGRVLYTSRDPHILETVAADLEQIDVLAPEAARALLAMLTGVRNPPPEAERILAATGRVALAIALLGAAIGAGGRGWSESAELLERGQATFLDHPYANAFKAMEVAIGGLDRTTAQAYRALAVYPPGELVPTGSVEQLWAHLFEWFPQEVNRRLDGLAARRLLAFEPDGIRFHDLQHAFLVLQADDLSLLHADLLAAYRSLLPADSRGWTDLPQSEPYIWEHLMYHLTEAEDGSGIRALVHDLGYLAFRSLKSGPYAAESDLRAAAELHPDDDAITWLVSLFAQMGYLFADQPTIADLLVTLVSRVRDAPEGISLGSLEQLLPTRYLDVQSGLQRWSRGLERVLEGHIGDVHGVAYSPDGRWLASISQAGPVLLREAIDCRVVALLEGHGFGGHAVAFSPDSGLLATAADTLRLWESVSAELVATLDGHEGMLYGVAFSPDGGRVASVGMDGTVRVWDPVTRRAVLTLQGDGSSVAGVAFSPDGRHFASCGHDCLVRLWDAMSGKSLAVLEGHTFWVTSLAFSPDGRWIVSAATGDCVRIWDAANGQAADARLEGNLGYVHCVAISKCGRRLAGGTTSGTINIWDFDTGKMTARLHGHSGFVNTVTFSPDGRQLASAGQDHTVRLWDAHSRELGPAEGGDDPLLTLAASPDGRLLVTSSEAGKIRLCDPATGHVAAVLESGGRWVASLAVSMDGHRLAAGRGRNVGIWDLRTRQLLRTIEAHEQSVTAIAFSRDGRRLATAGGWDETVRVWDLASGSLIGRITTEPGMVHGLCISPDGRHLVAATARAVLVWDADTLRATAILAGHTMVVGMLGLIGRPVRALSFSRDPSLSTSGETLTIEVSMNLEGENGERRTWRRARMELGQRLRLLPPTAKTSAA